MIPTAQHQKGHIYVVPPEQVPLDFELAGEGPRVLAFMLDMVIITGILLLLTFLASAAGVAVVGRSDTGLTYAFLNLFIFVVVNFYFVILELRWRGQTIGKRAAGIRVVARDGGPLSAPMVFARNLTRDFEFLLPLLIAMSGGEMLGISSGWLRFIAILWTFVVLFLPLFNRHRMRVGDIVAGTIVVRTPKGRLLPDLAVVDEEDAKRQPDFVFTDAQLDVYGVAELQLLEKVLRRDHRDWDPVLVTKIADNIKRKIGWPRDRWRVNDTLFLKDFYAAQRARLETGMLFGKRRHKKVR